MDNTERKRTMVSQRAVNPPPSGTVGSIPTRSTGCTHPMTIEDAEALVIVLCDQAGDVVPQDINRAAHHSVLAIVAAANYDFDCADIHSRAARILVGLPAVARKLTPFAVTVPR